MITIIIGIHYTKIDCVEVILDDTIRVSFDCRKCNASSHLNEPSDIAYLTRLARKEPELYAKLAVKNRALHWIIDAMEESN